jgi:hypothetical protein
LFLIGGFLKKIVSSETAWTFQGCLLPSFDSFGQAVLEEKIFLEINQSETRIVCGGHVC